MLIATHALDPHFTFRKLDYATFAFRESPDRIMASAPRVRCLTSCLCPLSGHIWYRPVHKRPDGGCWTAGCRSRPHHNETIPPRAGRLTRTLVQCSLLTSLVLLLIIWLGAEFEQYHVRNAHSTVDLYQGSEVCGIIVNSSDIVTGGIEIETFGSVAEFTLNEPNDKNKVVAHCGSCGSCSNPNDVRIYDNTRNTLFKQTATCAKKALLFGRQTATQCMAEAVGFTSGCSDCWVENIMCDLRYCVFSCLRYGIFSQKDGGHDPNSTGAALNPCTLCDEMRCGREFVTCAGANRRRSGILSDIQRNTETEVCHHVTPHWWEDELLQQQWRNQNQYGGDDLKKVPVADAGAIVDQVTYRNTKTETAAPSSEKEHGGFRRLRK